MKHFSVLSFLTFIFSWTSATANEFKDSIQRAVSDLREIKDIDKELNFDTLISSLNNLIENSEQATATVSSPITHYLADASPESLAIMTAPIFFIIAVICLYSAATQTKIIKTDKSTEFQKLKLAAIDFSISDEEFLIIRKNILK